MRLAIIISVFLAFSVFANSYVNEFLDIDADHITQSLGGARIASEGSSALFGNPANISSGKIFFFMSHEQMFDGLLISDACGWRFSAGKGNFAIGLVYAGGDGIDITALPDPNASVSPQNMPYKISEKGHHDFAFSGGYSIPVKNNLSAGAAGAIIYRNLVDKNAYGGALSLGVNWKPARDVMLGTAFRNLSYISWETGTNEFGAPSISLGGRYDKKIGENFSGRICVESEYLPQAQKIEGFAGIECAYDDLIAVRAGTKNGAFTAGTDLKIIDGIRFGASMIYISELPISYRVGLTLERAGGETH